MAMPLQTVKQALRAGKYAWPGGYPLYFIMEDGGALSFEAVREEWRQIVQDYLWKHNTGWMIAGVDINWEDDKLVCDHTGNPIESAYCD